MSKFLDKKRGARAAGASRERNSAKHDVKQGRRALKHDLARHVAARANTAYGRTQQGLRKTLDRMVKAEVLKVEKRPDGVEGGAPVDREGGAA